MPAYPSPGRGAWRTTGGLLPAKPGSTSNAGYYRLNAPGEIPVGGGWMQGLDTTHHARAVWLGTKAMQSLVGAVPDGWFGPGTDRAVRAAQQLWGIEDDGIVGRATMRSALTPMLRNVCGVTGVPIEIIGGLLTHESALDPAAVGVNGVDHGLAQINLKAHGDRVSLVQALTPDYAVDWTIQDLAKIAATWRGKTKADVWDIAIANHNSPLLAKRWAVTGEPPYVTGRVFQIEEYVQKVKAAWTENA